jgi:hypothetical protein
VANEIKELALKTAEATNDIRTKINGIQNATGSAVNDIGQIVKVISDVNEIVTTIAAAIEEQSAVTREVATNINQATTGVQDASVRPRKCPECPGTSPRTSRPWMDHRRHPLRRRAGPDQRGGTLQARRAAQGVGGAVQDLAGPGKSSGSVWCDPGPQQRGLVF